jgi:hypothetical protein
MAMLCAPTAFGKTVTAAALIARRKVSTLVLVHRTELLRQWQERLTGFLEIPKGGLGAIGDGKMKPSGKIDIAVMQSLSRREDLGELLDQADPPQRRQAGNRPGATGSLAESATRAGDPAGFTDSGGGSHPRQQLRAQPAHRRGCVGRLSGRAQGAGVHRTDRPFAAFAGGTGK